jgi:hypothetical protein
MTKTNLRRTAGAALIALAVVPWAMGRQATADSSSGSPGDHKVTICHRTNADSNPYVVITVDTDAAGGGKDLGAGDHAAEHQGPVWNATLKDQHIEWGDIIPPYVDDQGVAFPGLNWTTEGQALFNNGCAAVVSPPPTTTSAPVTTTTTPVTTTSPPVTVSPTSATASVSVLPTEATATAPGGAGGTRTSDTAVLGTKSGALAQTGVPALALVSLSLLLMLIGGALVVLPQWATESKQRRH